MTIKYFSGTKELSSVFFMRNAEFAAKFPGVKGRRVDSFSMLVGTAAGSREVFPVERAISYKSNPSLHACNGKCLNAKCNGACECICGGANHGLGGLSQILLAS